MPICIFQDLSSMLNSGSVLKVKTQNHCQYMSQVFNLTVPSQDYLPLLNTNCVTFLGIICHIIHVVCFTTLNQSLVSVTNTQFPMVCYTDGAMFTHTPHCHWPTHTLLPPWESETWYCPPPPEDEVLSMK